MKNVFLKIKMFFILLNNPEYPYINGNNLSEVQRGKGLDVIRDKEEIRGDDKWLFYTNIKTGIKFYWIKSGWRTDIGW